jgi:hypothetical protein
MTATSSPRPEWPAISFSPATPRSVEFPDGPPPARALIVRDGCSPRALPLLRPPPDGRGTGGAHLAASWSPCTARTGRNGATSIRGSGRTSNRAVSESWTGRDERPLRATGLAKTVSPGIVSSRIGPSPPHQCTTDRYTADRCTADRMVQLLGRTSPKSRTRSLTLASASPSRWSQGCTVPSKKQDGSTHMSHTGTGRSPCVRRNRYRGGSAMSTSRP